MSLPDEPPAPDAEPAGAALDVVALDDDEDFREYLRSLLEADGHDVRAVSTPDELYQACTQRLPDVVLLDLKMGHHSGDKVLADLRARWPRLCVVVVTGYPSLDSMRQTFKQDVFDYLAKPFSIDELRRTLAQAAAAYRLGGRPQDRLRHELGRQIRVARTERGWTLKELSEASGVSVSQVSSIERGAHLPSLESLLAIAVALQAKPSTWLAAAGF
ncbi:MAG TPA: response regulator [Phycisphaerales bacterium]|nr:response regulator [Phycisphaerales bacterium]